MLLSEQVVGVAAEGVTAEMGYTMVILCTIEQIVHEAVKEKYLLLGSYFEGSLIITQLWGAKLYHNRCGNVGAHHVE